MYPSPLPTDKWLLFVDRRGKCMDILTFNTTDHVCVLVGSSSNSTADCPDSGISILYVRQITYREHSVSIRFYVRI